MSRIYLKIACHVNKQENHNWNKKTTDSNLQVNQLSGSSDNNSNVAIYKYFNEQLPTLLKQGEKVENFIKKFKKN